MCGHVEFVWKQARSWDLFFQAGGGERVGWGGVCREKEPLRKLLAGSWAGLCCARGVNWLAGAGDRERVPFSPRTLSCSPAGFGP